MASFEQSVRMLESEMAWQNAVNGICISSIHHISGNDRHTCDNARQWCAFCMYRSEMNKIKFKLAVVP